jgi:predicted TIM-barrel fold metal-dependent hydrolase
MPEASSDLPWIVSVDDHVVEPPHLFQRWLPARFREAGPRVVELPYEQDGVAFRLTPSGPVTDVWTYEDLAKPIQTVTACAGMPNSDYSIGPIRFSEMRRGCFDPQARLADMDANWTEASLCFPTFPRFCGQTFLEAKDRELALACVKAYNDWMVEEWCGDSGGRLLPLGLIPLWDRDLAAAEVRRNALRGCRAVAFCELPHNLGLPSVHDRDRYWEPFFEACAETGTVVCMHIGSGSKMPTTSPDAPVAVTVALTSQNAMQSLVDWLVSGVLARHPDLKIAYSESQIGWMPFMLERLDTVFRVSRGWAPMDPSVVEPPSMYFKGRVYGCFFDDDFGLASRDAIGLEQIVFETDYPHQDTTWPNSKTLVEKYATVLSPAELQAVVHDNGLRMLGRNPTLPLLALSQ